MSTINASFNLVDDPWIKAIDLRGKAVECSLLEALLRAHELRDLVGEQASQDAAVLRFLLCVLRRALEGPRSRSAWQEIWDVGRFDEGRVRSYLEAHHERFELFHERAPFAQIPRDSQAHVALRTSALLVPSIAAGNNVPLFSSARDEEPFELLAGDATRWLIHLLGYDTAGIKTGLKGDPTVVGGKGHANVGPLGRFQAVWPLGANLFETLLLNSIPTSESDLVPRTGVEDLPLWERPALDATRTDRAPTGLCDLFVFSSRRVAMEGVGHGAGARVTGVLVGDGDHLLKDPVSGQVLPQWEPHAAWRRWRAQGSKPEHYRPVEASPDRQVWRGLEPLLARAVSVGVGGGRDVVAPSVLRWCARLLDQEVLPRVLSLRLAGLTYGTQSASVIDQVGDRLELATELLVNDELEQFVLDLASEASKVADALRRLAVDVVTARGGQGGGGRDAELETQFYFQCDPAYRAILVRILDEDRNALHREWQSRLAQIAGGLARELITNVDGSALVGRVRKENGVERRVTVPGAVGRYAKRLRDVLVLLDEPERRIFA